MQKLFENWRLFKKKILNDTLLESRAKDQATAAEVIISQDFKKTTEPNTFVPWMEGAGILIAEYLEGYIRATGKQNLNNNKFLLAFAKMLNWRLYHWHFIDGGLRNDLEQGQPERPSEFWKPGDPPSGIAAAVAGKWKHEERREVVRATETYTLFNDYHTRGIGLSSYDIDMYGPRAGLDPRSMGDTLEDLKKALGIPTNLGDPIDRRPRDAEEKKRQKLQRKMYSFDINKIADRADEPYFAFDAAVKIAKIMIRERDYRKDPEVRKKSEETTVITAGRGYTVFLVQSLESMCMLGCPGWCVSEIPPEEAAPDTHHFHTTYKDDRFVIVAFDHLRASNSPLKKLSLQYKSKFTREYNTLHPPESAGEPHNVTNCANKEQNINQDWPRQIQASGRRDHEYTFIEHAARENIIAGLMRGKHFTSKEAKQDIQKVTIDFYRWAGYPDLYDSDTYQDFIQLVHQLAQNQTFETRGQLLQFALYRLQMMSAAHKKNIYEKALKLLETAEEDPLKKRVRRIADFLFDGKNYPFAGVWKTIGEMAEQGGDVYDKSMPEVDRYHRVPDGIRGLIEYRFLYGYANKPGNIDILKLIESRIDQGESPRNIGAARNIVWAHLIKKMRERGISGAYSGPGNFGRKPGETPKQAMEVFKDYYIVFKIMQKQWDLLSLPQDPVAWAKEHRFELAEAITYMLTVALEHTAGLAEKVPFVKLTQPEHIWVLRKWVKSNRGLISAEVARILEENEEKAVKIAEAIMAENGPLQSVPVLTEAIWDVVYGTLSKELGHLVNKYLKLLVFGGDPERALQLALDHDERINPKGRFGDIQENKKPIRKINILIG